ncbi:hypothetical protein [Serratia fonticola]|jgi:hypothetical protein|uniref:Uncharacterized protein n=1 Tax=Serratia fonticola TaxID=47917 RepID=A0AAW3WWM2_SERFO|nr:hypothetical protein [Serratia fonticola]MBC3215308.1 hypothetical protein [Serratia fonticola]NYA16224.1 hypothetical protein [Serratia fonticola]NYA36005.1 hypothetical protein [Serratia fonticola]CAI2041666.1 Uncharacterised protein [Serratia fonticola]
MNTQNVNVNTAAQEPSERCGESLTDICQKDMPVLLKECLYVLNEVTNRRLPRGSLYPNTYALASAIEAVLLAVAQQQSAVIHRDQQEALSREAQARK